MRYLKMLLFIIIISLNPVIAVYAQNNITVESNNNSIYAIKTDGSLYEIPYIEEILTDETFFKHDYNYIIPSNMTSHKLMDNIISISDSNVLKEDKTVWNIMKNPNNPDYIMNEIESISAFSSLLMIKKDNTLWGIGNNANGQLAQGTMTKTLEEQIAENAMYKNNTKCFPENIDTPVKIMENVKKALIEWGVSVVLKNDGTVWTFGSDQGGATLGIGGRWLTNNIPTQILSDIKDIFLSDEAGFAIDYDNTLWRWGSNYSGYVGVPPAALIPEKYVEDVKSVTNMLGYNLIIKTDNSLWIYGDTKADGGEISKTPLKLLDNVVCTYRLKNNPDEKNIAIILTENRDLMYLNIEDTPEISFTVEKIIGNVRLPEDLPIQRVFNDISNKPEVMQESINSLSKADIISGTSETEFEPDKPITRAEIAELLLRVTAKQDNNGNGGFIDVSENQWYYHTAGASKKYGIVSGFEDNTFRGEETVSKLQAVALMARVLKSERDLDSEKYDSIEYSSLPEWASDDISIAEKEGLYSIKSDLSDPNEGMTRGEAAVILYRLYQKI